MAFFPSSSGFIVNGGNFMSFNFQTEGAATTDGLMILKAGDVELRRELISDGENSYRIHAASHGGRLVAVKTFEGPRAKQDWKVNVAFSKKCLHPNVLQIVGISDESSESHFIQFRGITSEQKMQWLIANALGTDLNTSVQLSMKAVKGIAAGLSYIKSQKIPVMYAGTMNNNQKWDNFDILTGYDNEPLIAFHLSSTVFEDGAVSQDLDIKTDGRGIEVLNGLCHQLFSGAHSILYDDSPEREFDIYDSEGESTSGLSESEAISNPMENMKPSRKPRREVWWLDLGVTIHSLKSIGRCFEDRLNWSLLSSSNSLLRHIRSPKDENLRRNLHQCPGYLREEITLTCDLSKSVIVSHAFPGLSERCSICRQLVQYTYSESFDYSASSVMGELFQPSLPFNEDMPVQSMQHINQDTAVPGSQWMQFRQNLGVDFGSGQTPSSSTPFPDYMDDSYSNYSYHMTTPQSPGPTNPEDTYTSSSVNYPAPSHMLPSSHAQGMHGHRPRIVTGHPRTASAADSTSPTSTSALSPSESSERYPCDKCGKTFSRPHDQRRHHETQHLVSPIFHICKYCRKAFSRADALKRHLTRCLH